MTVHLYVVNALEKRGFIVKSVEEREWGYSILVRRDDSEGYVHVVTRPGDAPTEVDAVIDFTGELNGPRVLPRERVSALLSVVGLDYEAARALAQLDAKAVNPGYSFARKAAEALERVGYLEYVGSLPVLAPLIVFKVSYKARAGLLSTRRVEKTGYAVFDGLGGSPCLIRGGRVECEGRMVSYTGDTLELARLLKPYSGKAISIDYITRRSGLSLQAAEDMVHRAVKAGIAEYTSRDGVRVRRLEPPISGEAPRAGEPPSHDWFMTPVKCLPGILRSLGALRRYVRLFYDVKDVTAVLYPAVAIVRKKEVVAVDAVTGARLPWLSSVLNRVFSCVYALLR